MKKKSIDARARPLTLLLALTLAACGGGGSDGGSNDDVNPAPPLERRAVVLTTDFTSSSLASLPVADPGAVALSEQTLSSDAVARAFGSRVYVINRFGADNIQALDANDGFRTLWQCSVGNGKNPQDMVVASEDKGYVSLYAGGVAVVNLSPAADCSDFLVQEIDLSSVADDDGIPEADRLVMVNRRLYVSLQRLENFVPTDSSALAVIDTTTDVLLGAIELSGTNPYGATKGLLLEPASGKLLVPQVGGFGVLDGGIERVDLAGGVAEGFFLTEAELGGDINDFVIVSDTRAYVVVSDANFNNRLVRFDPSTGAVQATLLDSSAYLPDIEHDSETDQLFVASQDFARPGIRIFDRNDMEATPEPIGTGLPPFVVLFVE